MNHRMLLVHKTDAGKRVLENLETSCHINKTTLPKTSGDSLRLAFNEGQRSVVLHIRNMLNFDLKTLEKFAKAREGE